MCDYLGDGDECSFFTETTRRAAKAHVCACCGVTIERGKRYAVVAFGMDGTVSSEKCCASCAGVRAKFGEAHSFYPHPSSVTEFLDQCIAERDDGYQRWARMLRRIRQRRQAAVKAEGRS